MNYSEEEIRLIVNNVAVSLDGFKFIDILIDKLGAFDRGCKFDNANMEYYNRGKKEQGLWLLDLLRDSNFEKYCEIVKQRRTSCQSKQKKEQD